MTDCASNAEEIKQIVGMAIGGILMIAVIWKAL